MSYNTTAEANEYIRTHYIAADPLRVAWEGYSDDDKTSLLNKAYSVINCLPLRGCKSDPEQEAAFPRCGGTEIPQQVKDAEAELALTMSDYDTMMAASEYKQKASYGIQSYKIGNFSETLLSYAKDSLSLQYGLVSSEAERLLLPWISGGFSIE